MTHGYFEKVAGADDTSAGGATELKWVLDEAPPHYFSLPISLNSLDREGVRLLSPCDSQITSKTRCRCR